MGLQWAYLNNNQKRENRPRATGKRGDPQHHPSPVRLQPFLNLHSGGGPWMWCTQPWVFSLQTCGWEVYQKENMYNSDYINAQKNYIIIAYYTVDILSAHSHNHIGLDRCWNMHVFCTRFYATLRMFVPLLRMSSMFLQKYIISESKVERSCRIFLLYVQMWHGNLPLFKQSLLNKTDHGGFQA